MGTVMLSSTIII